MPTGLTGGFDFVFAISTRTFGAIIEGMMRPQLLSLGNTGRDIPIPAGPGRAATTLFFDDMRVEAWAGSTVANAIEIRLAFFNARLGSAEAAISLGPNWSEFIFPATPAAEMVAVVPPTVGPPAINIILTSDFTRVVFDADDESLLVAPLPTEADIAAALGPAIVGAGLANPMVLTPTSIPIGPLAPAAAAGVFPTLSAISVIVQRRTGPAAAGEEAVAMLMNFQNRPNTPAARGIGDPALVPVSSFGVGQDLLLEIENTFLLEIIASMAFEAPPDVGGLAIPPASLAVTRAEGITLTAPVQVTLADTPGTLMALTLQPPTAGSAALTLGMRFDFTRDDITYAVIIAGATMTIGLSGTTIIVESDVPAADVTYTAPWWVSLRDFVIGVVVGGFIGGLPGMIIGGTVGALRVFIEGSIVATIAGPTVRGGIFDALGGAGGGLLPPALTALTGEAALSPPLEFDDLRAGARAMIPDVIQEYRRVASVEVGPGGWLNLESQMASGILLDKLRRDIVRNRFLEMRASSEAPANADLVWDPQSGLRAGPRAQLVMINGRFSLTSYTDAADALRSGTNVTIEAAQIPQVTPTHIAAEKIPAGLVLAVKTDVGRVAKVVAWRDEDDRLTVRYVVWDTSAAAMRIFPKMPEWQHTQTVVKDERPGPLDGQKTTTYWYASRAVLTARTHRMTPPLIYKWSLAGVTLMGNGSATVAGTQVHWVKSGAQLTLNLDLGESLMEAILVCEATDAGDVMASDSVQLKIAGREDVTSIELDPGRLAVFDSVIDSWRQWRGEPIDPGIGPPVGPDPVSGIESRVKTALVKGNVRFVEREFRIR